MAKREVQQVVFGPFTFDKTRRELRKAGPVVQLTNKEVELLEAFLDVDDQDDRVSRGDLRRALWRSATDGALTTLVQRLRSKLGDREKTCIETIDGFGYRFTGVFPEERDTPSYVKMVDHGYGTVPFFCDIFPDAKKEITVLGSSNNALSEGPILKRIVVEKKLKKDDFTFCVFFANPTNPLVINHEIRFNRQHKKPKKYMKLVIDAMDRFNTFFLEHVDDADLKPTEESEEIGDSTAAKKEKPARIQLYYYDVPRPAPTVIVDDLMYQGFMLAHAKADGPYIISDRTSELGQGLEATVEQMRAPAQQWTSKEAFMRTREMWKRQIPRVLEEMQVEGDQSDEDSGDS